MSEILLFSLATQKMRSGYENVQLGNKIRKKRVNV